MPRSQKIARGSPIAFGAARNRSQSRRASGAPGRSRLGLLPRVMLGLWLVSTAASAQSTGLQPPGGAAAPTKPATGVAARPSGSAPASSPAAGAAVVPASGSHSAVPNRAGTPPGGRAPSAQAAEAPLPWAAIIAAAVLGLLTLAFGALFFYYMRMEPTFEIESHWGGFGGGLEGWRLSRSVVFLLASLLFGALLALVAFGSLAPRTKEPAAALPAEAPRSPAAWARSTAPPAAPGASWS
jgi:hypothetical protein